MVAKLQQTRPAPGQAQPGAPRPGMPTRSSTPVPGQPIYRGPIRPGQPVMRGPGVGPGGQSPGGFRRPRTLHPTSPLRMEPATAIPTTEQQRRHQAKPGGRDRHRDVEQEEGRLRMPVSRREQQPAAPPPIDREITVSEGITVKELSEKLGIKANLVIKKLVEKKIFATINQNLEVKMAEEIAREFGASTNKVSFEEESTQELELAEETTDRVRRASITAKHRCWMPSVPLTWPNARPAASPSTSALITSKRTAGRLSSSTHPAMKPSRACARAALKSPISSCW
jgi:translation initiation factor IF-2